jgi:hypothetical protein
VNFNNQAGSRTMRLKEMRSLLLMLSPVTARLGISNAPGF